MEKIIDVSAVFSIDAEVSQVRPLGNGLINDTYLVVTTSGKGYVLQRINHLIFKDVPLLQDNIAKITAHIRAKLQASGETEIDRKVLDFIPVKDGGKTFFFDGESYWRMSVLIADSVTVDEELFSESRCLLGRS